MKKYPYFVLGSAIMVSVFFFGIILRNLERYYLLLIISSSLEQIWIEMDSLTTHGTHSG